MYVTHALSLQLWGCISTHFVTSSLSVYHWMLCTAETEQVSMVYLGTIYFESNCTTHKLTSSIGYLSQILMEETYPGIASKHVGQCLH